MQLCSNAKIHLCNATSSGYFVCNFALGRSPLQIFYKVQSNLLFRPTNTSNPELDGSFPRYQSYQLWLRKHSRWRPEFDRVASATLRASPALLGPSGAARTALRGELHAAASGARFDSATLLWHVYEADGPGAFDFCTATGRKVPA